MIQRVRSRRNLFVMLRLALALGVLIGHFFPIFGIDDPNYLASTLAGVSVLAFFFLSGFLITDSASRSSTRKFLIRRIMRIGPGLLVSLVLTSFLISPLIALIDGRTMFSFENFRYFDNLFLPLQLQHTIGDSVAGLPVSESINGSLWTLPVEFRLYLISLGLHLLLKKVLSGSIFWTISLHTMFFAFSFAFAFTSIAQEQLGFYSFSVALYAFGGLLRTLDDILPKTAWGVYISGILLFFSIGPEFLAILVLLLIFVPEFEFWRPPDLSYSIYVLAFPITQLCASVSFRLDWNQSAGIWMFLLSTTVIAFSMAVYKLIEIPSQRWSNLLR